MATSTPSISQKIQAHINALKEILKRLTVMSRLAKKKARPVTKGAPVATPASQRPKVIAQLVGILHAMGVNSPSIGPSSVYANPPIGFSKSQMESYCQICRKWFGCPALEDQAPTITINKMATAVLQAGGLPR